MNSLGINKEPKNTRVVVAMSGGVDSSVVAAKLKTEGYDVIGITMQLYSGNVSNNKPGKCCGGVDINDAIKVSRDFDFPHYVFDYEDEFKKNVIDSLEVARSKFPGSSNSLDNLCKKFNIDLSKRTKHNALLDCELLREVYINLLDAKEPKFNLSSNPLEQNINKTKDYNKTIVKISEDELSKGIMQYASQYPGQEKQIMEHLKKSPSSVESIRGPLLEDKIINSIISKVTKTSKKINEEQYKKLEEDTFDIKRNKK